MATVDDLRGLRRWFAVAAILAVAATVVAIIALLDEKPPVVQGDRLDTTSRLGRAEDRIERARERVDALDERIGNAAGADDLATLERRVRRAERESGELVETTADVNEALDKLQARVAAIEDRVEALESEPPTDGGGGGNGDSP